MLTVTSVHAYDWKGVNISEMSMTGDGYFEAPVSQNALENLKNGRGFQFQVWVSP